MIRRFAWVAGLVSLAGGSALGGTVVYTDLDLFRAAAGDVRVIDFETLPDGSPSPADATVEITSEFNYTSLGVTFSSLAPRLIIGGHPESGFGLCACPPVSSDPSRNWIIAGLDPPVFTVGVEFAGNMSLSISGPNGQFLGAATWGGTGDDFFLGLVSDLPIYSAVVDRGASANSAGIGAFYYSPIPEPTTLLLLVLGGGGRSYAVAGVEGHPRNTWLQSPYAPSFSSIVNKRPPRPGRQPLNSTRALSSISIPRAIN